VIVVWIQECVFHALVRALANDLGETGITVNAIAPTIVKTEGLIARTPTEGPSADEIMKFVVAQQTIKRPSTPEDAANALSFLVSEDAGFITGQILTWTAASVEAVHRMHRRINIGAFQTL
jgi:NAD(P)-dependent dehydrogenase (short-subunit alcohol dehydrogenase family)